MTSGYAVFSSLLGSTVDTYFCHEEYEKIGIFLGGHIWISSVFSAIWFDSGYMCLSVYGGVGFAGCDAPRCVFLRGFSGPDALYHGRYGPAGTVYGAVHKTAEIPQFQFIMVVVIPVITQRQIFMVLVTKRFPCCWTQ